MVKEIDQMLYSDLVALVGETNRPSGGLASIQELAAMALIGPGSQVLEIGCTTGFSAIALAEIAGAEVIGIDIQTSALKQAKDTAAARGTRGVRFELADATKLPYNSGSFDLVWASNVPSFVTDRGAVLAECVRVLRRRGALALVPIVYNSTPPLELSQAVERLLGVALPNWSIDDWLVAAREAARRVGRVVEVAHATHHRYCDESSRIANWCRDRCAGLNLRYDSEFAAKLARRYELAIATFNENLRHCSYFRLLMRVDEINDHQEELFRTVPYATLA